MNYIAIVFFTLLAGGGMAATNCGSIHRRKKTTSWRWVDNPPPMTPAIAERYPENLDVSLASSLLYSMLAVKIFSLSPLMWT